MSPTPEQLDFMEFPYGSQGQGSRFNTPPLPEYASLWLSVLHMRIVCRKSWEFCKNEDCLGITGFFIWGTKVRRVSSNNSLLAITYCLPYYTKSTN